MKTVFITGGATGIGAATVNKFVNEGWNTAFMDVNAEAAQKLMDDINLPLQTLFIEGNTRDRADIHLSLIHI